MAKRPTSVVADVRLLGAGASIVVIAIAAAAVAAGAVD
jgi:hypothetical protein